MRIGVAQSDHERLELLLVDLCHRAKLHALATALGVEHLALSSKRRSLVYDKIW